LRDVFAKLSKRIQSSNNSFDIEVNATEERVEPFVTIVSFFA
jgi:hypothetical protein